MNTQEEVQDAPDRNDETVGTSSGAAGPNPYVSSTHLENRHEHDIIRDQIADRTGELVESVANIIEGKNRSVFVAVQEPDTGVEGIALLEPGGSVEALPSSVFDQYRTAPKRIEGHLVAHRADSFVDAVNRYKQPATTIFAVEASQAVIAVLDCHERDQPAFCRAAVKHSMALSTEWKAWHAANGAKMSMVDFAAFIEENIVNVVQVSVDDLNSEMADFVKGSRGKLATPSQLFEMSRGLTVHEASSVKEVRNLTSGETQVVFQAEHVDQAGQPIDIPNMFCICIPVFHGSPDYYRIIARLRYRKSNGLTFWYDLWRADLVLRAAFEGAVKDIEEQTELPVYYGTPWA